MKISIYLSAALLLLGVCLAGCEKHPLALFPGIPPSPAPIVRNSSTSKP